MEIKICGIRNSKDVSTSLQFDIDKLGFIVGATHKTEDEISPEKAKELIELVPENISTIIVTHLKNPEKIAEIITITKAKEVQLHDDISIEDIKKLRTLLPKTILIKAVHVTDESSISKAKEFEDIVDIIILDTATNTRIGGTGLTHNWDVSKKIVEQLKIPVFLAGGLNKDNVYDAIKKVNPYGVDLNSGVETNGDKDPKLLKAFVENAKRGVK